MRADMGDWMNFENRAAVGRAVRLRREIDDFETRWPKADPSEEVTPTFSWTQLERQLVDLAATETQAEMARHLVSATRKLARFKPPDENFRPGLGEGQMDSV
jgi:hypothetical protein